MKIRYAIVLIVLYGCEAEPPPSKQAIYNPNQWPNDTEEVFQNAEALKFEKARREVEQAKIDALGVEGVPPMQPLKPQTSTQVPPSEPPPRE